MRDHGIRYYHVKWRGGYDKVRYIAIGRVEVAPRSSTPLDTFRIQTKLL